MTDQLMRIRQMLYSGEPVGEAFIFEVAGRLGFNAQLLAPFAGSKLINFYQDAICGGLVLNLGEVRPANIEVPLVFQSALSGVMLAAEVCANAIGARPVDFPAKTVIDVTRRLSKRLSTRVAKTPNCICADRDFQDQYKAKYDSLGVT